MECEIVGYDAVNHILALRYETGNTYHYVNVPPEIHDAMLVAENKMAFFVENIQKQLSVIRNSPSDIGRCTCGLIHFFQEKHA